jgi:MerR family redox-sensitive transcriptional activator SoxR
VSEPKQRAAAWTEERSDEGRRRLPGAPQARGQALRVDSPARFLTIAELSARSGAAPSALRYYEDIGLIQADRTSGNQRRYPRYVLRRIAFIRAGRQLGLSLREIKAALDTLPEDKAPTRAQWRRAARAWQARIDGRVAELQRLSDTLGGCIGCGCLSLGTCALYNPQDSAADLGAGARWLLGDESPAGPQ